MSDFSSEALRIDGDPAGDHRESVDTAPSLSPRIRRLLAALRVDRYPLCIEKLKIVLASQHATRNEPQILRRAKCLESVLDRMPVFIESGELIVGQGASRPMGLELDADYGIWSPEEIESLKASGFDITPEDESALAALYRHHAPRTLTAAIGAISGESERLWPFLRSGVVLPPWKDKTEGPGGGYAQSGLGLGPGFYLMCVDIPRVLNRGLNGLIAEAEEERRCLSFLEPHAADKAVYLESVILTYRALIRFADRHAALADAIAAETSDPARREELRLIARSCRRVPAEPAGSFVEALQAFWFLFLVLNPSPTAAAGRFDQYMVPFYERDLATGKIDETGAIEWLACLRIKDMQLNRVSGKANRQKNAGLAKWHNWTLGGVTADGRDATNALTYLLLDCAKLTRLPHHTLTLRVHEGTPEELLVKALEVVQTGLGLPAFVGDRSYIEYFRSNGVPVERARDYVVTGCLDANLPGSSRTCAIGMFVVPLVLEMFLHDGIDRRTGLRVGPPAGNLETCEDFPAFLAAFKQHLRHFMALAAEKNNLELSVSRELFPDPLRSSLMDDGLRCGKDVLARTMPFENGAVLNPVGMINVADSLAAIRRLVYDERSIRLSDLISALDANWVGHENLRARCLACPKFGNGDDYVDQLARDLYAFWADTTTEFPTALGGTHKPTAISITSHQPGGALTGATPDGRRAGDLCADGTLSPMQGADRNGPARALASALNIDQDPYQATLLNLKLHPSALSTPADLRKAALLIRTYLTHGGKHLQFNVVDRATLVDAQAHPDRHHDLTVRVAGYSAYFVHLGKVMQDEIIARTEHRAC